MTPTVKVQPDRTNWQPFAKEANRSCGRARMATHEVDHGRVHRIFT